jgi:predicted O-methyltransferase YrrM
MLRASTHGLDDDDAGGGAVKIKEIRRRGPSWMLGVAATLVRDRLLDTKDSLSRSEFARLHSLVRPFTECGNARLRGLYNAVRHVVAYDIPGDIVECGTARGGSAALMGLTLRTLEARRTLWLFDTFEGLPPPSGADPDREIAELYVGDFRGGLEDVQGLFKRLHILEGTRMVKGLFQETLSTAEVGAISVLHLDGDWYDSVRVCLDELYDRVSPGGIVQIDDYGHWDGARKAVDEFFVRRSIGASLRRLDYTGRAFVKP